MNLEVDSRAIGKGEVPERRGDKLEESVFLQAEPEMLFVKSSCSTDYFGTPEGLNGISHLNDLLE